MMDAIEYIKSLPKIYHDNESEWDLELVSYPNPFWYEMIEEEN